ncbi:hypothetical protein C8J56DRAFT_1051945 [Mycena floridula]|nr:hypothetical protein C8J56DRAFT_1051945 [Mycena floridula]
MKRELDVENSANADHLTKRTSKVCQVDRNDPVPEKDDTRSPPTIPTFSVHQDTDGYIKHPYKLTPWGEYLPKIKGYESHLWVLFVGRDQDSGHHHQRAQCG